MINEELFLTIVDSTPLVSIDLVIRNEQGLVLLGKRMNRPAQGYWFVPGGRIRKNELVQDALKRIAKAELGVMLESATLMGVYDHIYEDNYHGRPGINTHYVVLGVSGRLSERTPLRLDEQHSEVRWWTVKDLLQAADVHQNTKKYFLEGWGMQA